MELVQDDASFSLETLLKRLGKDLEVLCVEDNEGHAILLGYYLKPYCSVDHAGSAHQVLPLVQSKLYDLILMDIHLGEGINGMELCREIRKIDRYKTVPVAAITGYVSPEEKSQVIEAGINYYLAKPFNKEELLSLLREILLKHFFSNRGFLPTGSVSVP
ncbi:MAG TPA: response regulator [Bacteroidales bacterium]|nr:response regulator [Bacteroidales bacterium]HSA43060.1 response regulator [Bacteroidales bacterium]